MKEKGGILLFVLLGGVLLLIILIGWYTTERNRNTPSFSVQTKVQIPSSSILTSSPSPQTQSQNDFIKLTSPLGNEMWQIRKTETISWDQKGLDYWGNQVKICLFAVDENQNTILPLSKWTDQLCTHKLGTVDGAYLIADVVLTKKEYLWTIPDDFFTRFKKKPAAFKVSLQVYDNLPFDGRTEWAGLVGDDESPNYFEITAQ